MQQAPSKFRRALSSTKQIITARRPSDWPKGSIKFVNIYIVALHLITICGGLAFSSDLDCDKIIGSLSAHCNWIADKKPQSVKGVIDLLYIVHPFIFYIFSLIAFFALTDGPFLSNITFFLVIASFVAFSFYNALCRLLLAIFVISTVWSFLPGFLIK